MSGFLFIFAADKLYNKVDVMKKLLLMILAGIQVCSEAVAQNDSVPAKGSGTFGETVAKIWDKTKQGIKNSGTAIGDELSYRPGEYRVNGTFYMPLYDTNLYKGNDGGGMRELCRNSFNKRYPQALIQTCVIPQTEWLTEEVKKEDKTVGYLSSMYCYIIARDGADGYINARFLFQAYRKVGQTAYAVAGKWPLWERTDVMPVKDYKKLKKK